MKKLLNCLFLFGPIVQLLSSSVYAGHRVKYKIMTNQLKGQEYIFQLKDGANPDILERPRLRLSGNYKAKKERREMYKAMDEAEALARQGKRNLIQLPNEK